MSVLENVGRPARVSRFRPGAVLTRVLNPRYASLPPAFLRKPVRILDAGCGPQEALIARRLFASCWFEGIDITDLPPGSPERRAFDRYHQVDLDQTDLSFVPDAGFDYVICSHTIEHLENGIALVARLCAKVRPGGRLYLEWPSVESQTFPVRGFGLNFFDDGTHKQTFPLETVAAVVEENGLVIEYAGRRRQVARMLLAPVLAACHSLRATRVTLYDFWDILGSCYVVRAMRPLATQVGPRLREPAGEPGPLRRRDPPHAAASVQIAKGNPHDTSV
jgi:SAM-dependent methyltransferase